MARCATIKANGQRCRAQAITGNGFCYVHAPELAETRKRNNRKGGPRGGRGRPGVEIANLKGQLSNLYDAVIEGDVEPKVAAVAAQVANVRTRLVETELKVKEQQELEERLTELEEALERKKKEGRRPWGI